MRLPTLRPGGDPGVRDDRSSRLPMRLVTGVLAGALVGVLSGCSGSSGTGSAAATTSAVPTPSSTGTDGPVVATTKPTKAPGKGAPATGSTGAPSVAVSFAPPVKAGVAAPLAAQVQVTAGKIRTITVGANGPGEVAGSAVAVPLTVKNTSGKAFDLDGLAVNVTYDQGTPGNQTTAGPTKLLTGSLKTGATRSGTYVFTVPEKYASSVVIQVASDESPTIVQFTRN